MATAWEDVRRELEGLPDDASTLSREELAAIAESLRGLSWTLGDISAATGVPKTTIHRWTRDPVAMPTDGQRRSKVGLAVAGAAAVAYLIAIWKGMHE